MGITQINLNMNGNTYLVPRKVGNMSRREKNETNQSVKSERHNYVNIVDDNSRMRRGMLEAFSYCGAGDIHLHSVDVCGVRRSYGRTEYLVDKTGKGETEWIAQYLLPLCSE